MRRVGCGLIDSTYDREGSYRVSGGHDGADDHAFEEGKVVGTSARFDSAPQEETNAKCRQEGTNDGKCQDGSHISEKRLTMHREAGFEDDKGQQHHKEGFIVESHIARQEWSKIPCHSNKHTQHHFRTGVSTNPGLVEEGQQNATKIGSRSEQTYLPQEILADI